LQERPGQLVYSRGMERETTQAVLAVDLDGTLIHGDLTVLSAWQLLCGNPLYIFLLPLWLLRGRASLKRQVASRVSIAPASLRYNSPVLDYVQQQFESGVYTVLASGSDAQLVQPVADFLGCFREVVASDGETNRIGHLKQELLAQQFAASGYDYIGNSRVDIPVWEGAKRVLVASPSARFSRRLRARFEVIHVLD
jgi:hypothetical protein